MANPGESSSARTAGAVFLLAIVLLAPSLGKPFHIDDPVVLAVTQRILIDWTDPFGGDFDWFGRQMPLWRATTNPPLLSYYLAPGVAWFGYSEIWLHLFLLPFLVLLVAATLWLARRFCDHPWPAALFVLGSPAVVVSLNLMRDVPALALSSGALALAVRASDRNRPTGLVIGSLLLGAAILTKYSAAVLLLVLAFLPAYRRQWKLCALSLVSLLPLGGWCLWTWKVYGAAHPLFLLWGGHSNRTFGPLDNLLGALAILGSCLILAPAASRLLSGTDRDGGTRHRLWISGLVALVAVIAGWAHRGEVSLQYALWIGSGVLLLCGVALGTKAPRQLGRNGDEAMLLTWLVAPLLFSVFLIPFQAVRHLLPVLPPLCLLLFRRIDSAGKGTAPSGAFVLLLLAVQFALTGAVAFADHVYAACYRDAARRVRASGMAEERPTWFVGHWGWMLYAQRAGFRQLHGDGAGPEPGDLLIWPQRVHIGQVFQGNPDWRRNLELAREFECQSAWPVRTMNFEGAAFYAVIRGNAPFAFQAPALERFRVYRVREE